MRAGASLVALLLPSFCAAATAQPADAPADTGSPMRAFLPSVPLTALKATRERPLFVPSRRPPLAAAMPVLIPAAPPAPHVDEPLRLTLLGIIRAPEGTRSAVVMDETDHTSYSLKMGDNRRGWVVRSVDGDAVTLQRRERSTRLTYQPTTQPTPIFPLKNLPAN